MKMFCRSCGKELKEGSKFCVYCGAGQGSDYEPVVETQQEHVGEEERLRRIIGKNADAYLARFEELRSGGKDRMNWASFFLSLFHAAYRNVWKDWLKAVKWPLIMEAVCLAAAGICLLASPVTGMLLMIPLWIGAMWMLVMQILFAKRFNRIYLRHVEQKLDHGDDTPDPSGKRVILVWLIYAAVYLVIGLVFSAGMMGSLLNIGSDDYADVDRELMEYAQGAYEEELPEEEWIPEDVDLSDEEWDEEVPMESADTAISWEGDYQRSHGPSAYLMIGPEDEQGILFSLSVGYSGYLAYVDIREYEAEWQGDGTAVYRDGDYELSFARQEDGTLLLTENRESPYGLRLSGVYPMAGDAVFPDCECIFPDSDTREIMEADCEGLTALECRIAKNEIYARHGRRFRDEALQNYFDSCTWYEGYIEPEDFTEQMLTDSDMLSLHAIEAYESRMGF